MQQNIDETFFSRMSAYGYGSSYAAGSRDAGRFTLMISISIVVYVGLDSGRQQRRPFSTHVLLYIHMHNIYCLIIIVDMIYYYITSRSVTGRTVAYLSAAHGAKISTKRKGCRGNSAFNIGY